MAHDILSAGVSVQVKDQTSYAAVTAGTVSAAVGFAEKGPIDTPTLILSSEEFATTFGSPISDNYYLGMFAEKFLDHSVGYFTRIGKTSEYEVLTGTVLPGLAFTAVANPELFIELAGFPEPNNGLYRVTWASAGATYSDVDALAVAINAAFVNVTLADGATKLSAYVTAGSSSSLLTFTSDVAGNVTMTVLATEDAVENVVKVSGAAHLGMVDGASSLDSNTYSYSSVRVPVNEVAASAGTITGGAIVTQAKLNTLSAWNLVNIKIDNDGTNPYKEYEDINIVPTVGTAATFSALQAGNDPVAHNWVGTTFTITPAGFYDFMSGDVTGDINKAHTVTLTFNNDPVNLAGLISALNIALSGITTSGANTLDDYLQFAIYNTTAIQIVKGIDATLYNLGSQCSVAVADGTGTIANLGYTAVTNYSASGGDSFYTAEGVAAKIAAAIAEGTASSSIDVISITSNRTGTTSYIEIEDATTTATSALATGAIFDGIFTTDDSDSGSNSSNDGVANFVAKDAGTWGDSIKTRTYTTTNPVTSALEYYIEVYDGDDSVEVWGPVNWVTSTAANYVVTILEASDYVRLDLGETIEYPDTDTTITALTDTPPNNADSGEPAYWVLTGGGDGIPSIDAESDALVVSALGEYTNKEQYEIDLLLAPGFSGSSVVSKLQTVGEARRDIIALVDPPSFLSYTDIIDWHNGSYGAPASTALTSSFVVLLWDWQRDYDATNEQYIDLPPSIYEAVAIAKTQKNYSLWSAPAGIERGVVGSISTYSKPTAAQREYLYNDTDPACVNPIVQFPSEGILIYGQKTCLKTTKATNRINVRRLVNSITRNVERIGRKYVFKLHNASTWASISREINSYLSNIQERGGLTAFSVAFDSTTNTATRIDQGIMYGKIFIQPTKVAERIFIDLTIQNTGAVATEA